MTEYRFEKAKEKILLEDFVSNIFVTTKEREVKVSVFDEKGRHISDGYYLRQGKGYVMTSQQEFEVEDEQPVQKDESN